MMNDDARLVIFDILSRRFNTAELQNLVFDLGIDYEHLTGRGKVDKLLGLILYVERHALMEELINEIQRQRPDLQLAKELYAATSLKSDHTPDQRKQLRRFYDQVNTLQHQLQDIQDITSLGLEDAQDLLNQLEDAPHELLADLLKKSDDPDLISYAEQFADLEHKFGIALVSQGNWYAGLNRLKRSLTIRRLLPDLDARADTIYQIGRTYHLMGDLAEAKIRYRDALRLYEHTQNESGQAICNLNLGNVDIQLGFLDKGASKIEETKSYYLKTGDSKKVKEIEEVLQFVNWTKVREMA